MAHLNKSGILFRWLLTLLRGMVYSSYQERRWTNASLLCEMPSQEGNEERSEYNHEEWQAGNPGRLSRMRDQDVPHRQELKLVSYGGIGKAGHVHMPSLSFIDYVSPD